jgi:hypothetical protein
VSLAYWNIGATTLTAARKKKLGLGGYKPREQEPNEAHANRICAWGKGPLVLEREIVRAGANDHKNFKSRGCGC